MAGVGEAARLLKLKGSAGAWLYEHQSGTETKQRQGYPMPNDRKSRPKSGNQGMQCFHSFSLYGFLLLEFRRGLPADLSSCVCHHSFQKKKAAGIAKKCGALKKKD
jgi:hypothetical protein